MEYRGPTKLAKVTHSLKPILTPPLTHLSFRVCCLISTHLWISQFFSLFLISNFIKLWTGNIFCTISVFWDVLKFALWPNKWPILENVPRDLEKKIHSVAIGRGVQQVSVRRFPCRASIVSSSLCLGCFAHYWRRGAAVTNYYCSMSLSLFGSVGLGSRLRGSTVRCASLYRRVFLLDWRLLPL